MIQSNNVDLIVDLWSRIKPYIPVKERADVADSIIAVFDDFGMTDGLEKEQGLDKELKTAIKDYYGELDNGDDDDDNDEY